MVLVANRAPRRAAKPPTKPGASQPQAAEQQVSCRSSGPDIYSMSAACCLASTILLRLHNASHVPSDSCDCMAGSVVAVPAFCPAI